MKENVSGCFSEHSVYVGIYTQRSTHNCTLLYNYDE